MKTCMRCGRELKDKKSIQRKFGPKCWKRWQHEQSEIGTEDNQITIDEVISVRVMKFRAWDGKEMQPAFDLSQNPKYWWEGNKDFPLMQFAGLKDKNGKEIYEGDIYQYNIQAYTDGHPTEFNFSEIVTFENGAFWVGGYQLIDALENDSESEIIGNIYENRELLEGAE